MQLNFYLQKIEFLNLTLQINQIKFFLYKKKMELQFLFKKKLNFIFCIEKLNFKFLLYKSMELKFLL